MKTIEALDLKKFNLLTPQETDEINGGKRTYKYTGSSTQVDATDTDFSYRSYGRQTRWEFGPFKGSWKTTTDEKGPCNDSCPEH